MLGDHGLGVAVVASGSPRDMGGQLVYLNTQRRWNWGAGISRSPYVMGYAVGTANGTVGYLLAHVAVDNGSVFTQFPLSATRRFELGTGLTHYSYFLEQVSVVNSNGRARTQRTTLDSPPGLSLFEGSAA